MVFPKLLGLQTAQTLALGSQREGQPYFSQKAVKKAFLLLPPTPAAAGGIDRGTMPTRAAFSTSTVHFLSLLLVSRLAALTLYVIPVFLWISFPAVQLLYSSAVLCRLPSQKAMQCWLEMLCCDPDV